MGEIDVLTRSNNGFLSPGNILRGFLIVILLLLAFMLAVFLYFGWQRSIRETQKREDVAPQNGRFIKISDGQIYIQETGTVSDKPVLFIHGAGAWSELWRATLDQCQPHGLYCIALDVPPFGFSEVAESAHYTR